MRTPKQIAASRANGALSRGPTTPEGKAKAARNNNRHGLLAKAVVLEGESEALFNELVDKLNESFKPESQIDHLLVGKMAAAHWRQIRIWELERAGEPNLNDFEMRLDRQFFRTLDRYVRLRTMKNFFKDSNPTTP